MKWTPLLLAVVFSASSNGAEEQKLGVDVGKTSAFTKLAPAEDVEKMALTQYRLQLDEARKQKALAPDDDPQLVRNIVADGCERARKLAEETMRDVRSAMGLDYT